MVEVKATLMALQSLALAVSSAKPVILSGHVGAGKTCLLEYLAQITQHTDQLVKVSSLSSYVHRFAYCRSVDVV